MLNKAYYLAQLDICVWKQRRLTVDASILDNRACCCKKNNQSVHQGQVMFCVEAPLTKEASILLMNMLKVINISPTDCILVYWDINQKETPFIQGEAVIFSCDACLAYVISLIKPRYMLGMGNALKPFLSSFSLDQYSIVAHPNDLLTKLVSKKTAYHQLISIKPHVDIHAD